MSDSFIFSLYLVPNLHAVFHLFFYSIVAFMVKFQLSHFITAEGFLQYEKCYFLPGNCTINHSNNNNNDNSCFLCLVQYFYQRCFSVVLMLLQYIYRFWGFFCYMFPYLSSQEKYSALTLFRGGVQLQIHSRHHK